MQLSHLAEEREAQDSLLKEAEEKTRSDETEFQNGHLVAFWPCQENATRDGKGGSREACKAGPRPSS